MWKLFWLVLHFKIKNEAKNLKKEVILEAKEEVHKLKAECERQGLNIELEVDGGIYSENVHLPISAGANVIVAGSAFFKSNDTRKIVKELKGEKVEEILIWK